MIYLSCPYTHCDPSVREYRYRTSCRVAAKLMESGIVVFNPLSHSVPLCEFLDKKNFDHEFWMSIDLPILCRCDELLILGLPCWTESRGVKAEMFEALGLQKPITLIEEADIELLPSIPKTARRYLSSDVFKERAA